MSLDPTVANALTTMRPRVLRGIGSLSLIDPRHVVCAVADAAGRVVSVDRPERLGVVHASVAAILASHGERLSPGDVVMTNDPFSGGTHLLDLTMVRPVWSGDAPVGFAIVQCPLPDIGGMAVGGFYPFALEIWAEGVRVTPTRLYRAGVLGRDALTMLTLNSRLPHLVENDVRAVAGALDAGVGVLEGSDAGALRDGFASAGEEGARALRRLLEGLSSAAAEGEGAPVHCCLEDRPLSAKVAIRCEEGALQLDFAGSSGAARGFVNATASCSVSAAVAAVLGAFPSVPASSGVLDVVSVVVPEGSFLDARLPVSVGWAPYQPSLAVVQAVSSALEKLPGVHIDRDRAEAWFSPRRPVFTTHGCGRNGCPFAPPIA